MITFSSKQTRTLMICYRPMSAISAKTTPVQPFIRRSRGDSSGWSADLQIHAELAVAQAFGRQIRNRDRFPVAGFTQVFQQRK